MQEKAVCIVLNGVTDGQKLFTPNDCSVICVPTAHQYHSAVMEAALDSHTPLRLPLEVQGQPPLKSFFVSPLSIDQVRSLLTPILNFSHVDFSLLIVLGFVMQSLD